MLYAVLFLVLQYNKKPSCIHSGHDTRRDQHPIGRAERAKTCFETRQGLLGRCGNNDQKIDEQRQGTEARQQWCVQILANGPMVGPMVEQRVDEERKAQH